MRGARWLRRAALALILLVAALAVLTVREVTAGERAMASSELAFDQGDVRGATQFAREAALHYVPGAPHVRAALERLVALGMGAEAAGDRPAAAAAWRAVRAVCLETRHVWVPHGAELQRANKNLARLDAFALAGESRSSEAAEPAYLARLQSEARELLVRSRSPRGPWLAVMGVGLALAAVGLGLFVGSGVTSDGTLVPGGVRWALLVFAIGAACWTIAAVAA